MVSVTGTYSKTIYKDEITGFACFYLESNTDGIISEICCLGIIPDYPIGIPLYVTGEEEDGKIRIKECKPAGKPFPATLFLSIKGIGEEKVKKIREITGSDVFEFAQRKDAQIKLKEGLGNNDAQKILKKIREVSEMQELLSFVISFGGNYAQTVAILKKYNDNVLDKVKSNPYKISELPFTVQEKIGKIYGISPMDEDRISSLINTAFNNIKNSGHTYVDAKTFIDFVSRAEAKRGTDPFFIFSVLVKENKKYKIEKEDGKVRIYKKSDFDNEVIAAKNISRIISTRKPLPIGSINISDIENECGIQFDEDQEKAFELLKDTGIKVLTGGPGTGKTATMNGIVDAFLKMNPNAKISLCSPTANAAKRLSESTGFRASTVHKLLNLKPFGDCFDAVDNLDSDLIIVDEASMVDMELLVMLVKAIKNGALLLFVGDEDQLPSVGNGNVLHDLLKSENIPKVRLRTIHRQHGTCSIVENSAKIRKGDKNLTEDDVSAFITVKDEEELRRTIIAEAEKYYDISTPKKTRIFSPTRRTRYSYSTTSLNKELHALFNTKAEEYEELKRGCRVFSKGDPIIMTKNNYLSGYCNGDEGTVEAVLGEGIHRYLLVKIEDKILEIKGKDLEDIELAYAITTHKAQGSECENAIIVIPQKPIALLDRSLIYVAATRAKKKNIFIIQDNALSKGISNSKLTKRFTSLTEKIDGEFKKKIKK